MKKVLKIIEPKITKDINKSSRTVSYEILKNRNIKHLMTESDIVNYLIKLDDELRQTYLVYQDILHALKKTNYQLLKSTLSNYQKKDIKLN